MNKKILKFKKEILGEIIRYSIGKYPIEGCGYLGGRGECVTTFIPLKNIDNSSEHFSMDPKEQFEVLKKLREEGVKIIGVYHSHPYTPARPSEEDIKLAYDPDIYYVIVSLKDYRAEVKAFKIKNRIVEEEQILVEE